MDPEWDEEGTADVMLECPCLLSDSSMTRCDVSVRIAGAGAGACVAGTRWAFMENCLGQVQEVPVAEGDASRIFMAVPGRLQSVQRAELWGALLALQAWSPAHVGVDILNVVQAVGRRLQGASLRVAVEMQTDGDLLLGRRPIRDARSKYSWHDRLGEISSAENVGNGRADAAVAAGQRWAVMVPGGV